MAEPIISARGTELVYRSKKGDVTALQALDLDIHPGEVIALLGASGCGKSTLLNLFAGFLTPTSGEVRFQGQLVTGVNPRLPMIFQSYALFPWKTVMGNVEFGPALAGVPKEQRRATAQRFIEMVGLKGFEAKYPNQLSGGMRQRVALCRALANDPHVLLCDEPFAALDAMTRQVMQQELLRIAAEQHMTVVFVTHSIDEALIISDRIVVMSARPGRVKELRDNPLPKPRDVAVQSSEPWRAEKDAIWKIVEAEVLASLAEVGAVR
jgi:NitT/TauT family transport system ATP-binding protein